MRRFLPKIFLFGIILFFFGSFAKSAQAVVAPGSGSLNLGAAGGNFAEQPTIQDYNTTVNQQLGIGSSGAAGTGTTGTSGLAGEAYNLFQTDSTIYALVRGMVGNSTGTGGSAMGYNGGAAGFFAMATGSLYQNKPASTGDYINYMARNAGFPSPIPVAYAQTNGIGFAGLNPVLNLWAAVRNVAYLLFAVVFLVVGVMIMLRVKIDPKTVITIQSALPKVIFALIVITFSYPIAGFLIDLMYLLIGVILQLFSNSGFLTGGQLQNFQSGLQGRTIFEFVGLNFFQGVVVGSGNNIQKMIESLTGNVLFASGLFGFIGGAIAELIISIAIIYALFRTWLMLLGAYINIIIGVILGPIMMVADVIPGQSGFSNWIRMMLSNLLQFPLVVGLLVFGGALAANSGQGGVLQPSGAGGAFVPPLIGGNDLTAIPALMGLGILLMIPKASGMLQEWLKATPFKYGTAWGEAFGAGMAVGRAGLGQAYELTGIPAAQEAARKKRGENIAGSTTDWRRFFIGPK